MHSWRIRIVPFLESTTWYHTYDFDKAWNGPSNIKLANSGFSYFECPFDASHAIPPHTQYFAVVGPQTAWSPDKPRSIDDVTDDLATTILLVEAEGHNVVWTEPKDVSFEEAVELLTTPVQVGSGKRHLHYEGLFYKPSVIRNVAFVDGSVRALHMPLPEDLAVALLTVDGGEEIDEADFDRVTQPQLDYAKIYAFSVFVLLAVLPGVKLWRGRGSCEPLARG